MSVSLATKILVTSNMLHSLSLIHVLKQSCSYVSYVTSIHVVRVMLVFFDCAHIESRPRERTAVKTASQKLLGRCSHWLAWNAMRTEPRLTALLVPFQCLSVALKATRIIVAEAPRGCWNTTDSV